MRQVCEGDCAMIPNAIDQRRVQAPYRDRRIHVHVAITPRDARFVIRDEGPGFKPGDVPDPTDPENLERESGRGLLLMRSFMDEVSYNEQGNEVTLVKKPVNVAAEPLEGDG